MTTYDTMTGYEYDRHARERQAWLARPDVQTPPLMWLDYCCVPCGRPISVAPHASGRRSDFVRHDCFGCNRNTKHRFVGYSRSEWFPMPKERDLLVKETRKRCRVPATFPCDDPARPRHNASCRRKRNHQEAHLTYLSCQQTGCNYGKAARASRMEAS